MEDALGLRWYWSVIRRWLWLVVVCTLLGAASAFWVSSRMPPVYSAAATLLVYQAPTTGVSEYTAIRTSELLARTYSQMLSGRPVLEAVIARLELEEAPDALANRVDIQLVRDTQLILLSVEDTGPARAALIANAIAETFIAQIEALQAGRYADSLASMQEQIVELSALVEETQAAIDSLGTPATAQEEAQLARLETILAGYRGTYATLQQNYEQVRLTAAQSTDNVILVERAQGPSRPVRPRPMLNTALAAAVGAMLAVGAAFLVEYLDDRIKTADDARQALDLGTLGAISRMANGKDELIVDAQPFSPVAEAFRVLGTNIRFSNVDSPLRTILVTSTRRAEGKSSIVSNLAVAVAQAGLRVVAVDADLRRPRLHQLFGLGPGRKGLSEALLDGRSDDKLTQTRVERLAILTSGAPTFATVNPVGTLGSQRMQEVLAELAQRADLVLIDSPPVMPVADAVALAPAVDGVLLVVEAGKTRRQDARHVVESLRQVRANLIGVVLNAAPGPQDSYYHSYEAYFGNDGGDREPRWRKRFLAAVRRLFGRRQSAG